MAILGTINKQSREKLDFDLDYTTVLAGRTDTIATATSEVTPSGLTVVSPSLNGNLAKIVFSGGTDTGLYKISVLATSTAGLIYEDDIQVMVGDV